MRIDQLSENQRLALTQALEQDGFTDIKDHKTYLSFRKFPREYEMHSLNIESDFGQDNLLIILEENKIFELVKDKSSKTVERQLDLKKQQKSRHSTSLSQKDSSSFDIEREIQEGELPGWSVIDALTLQTDVPGIYSVPEKSDRFLHLEIKYKEHFAFNHGPNGEYIVYEGSPDILRNMITAHPETFFDAPTLTKTIQNIKNEASRG